MKSKFWVRFAGTDSTEHEIVPRYPFPSSAVKEMAEQLRLRGEWTATVRDEDGHTTIWKLSHQDLYYVRPDDLENAQDKNS